MCSRNVILSRGAAAVYWSFLSLIGTGWPTNSHAQALVVDQQGAGIAEFAIRLTVTGPTLQQSFIPSMSTIRFVQLGFQNSGTTGSVVVKLLQSTNDGSVLATTQTATVMTSKTNGFTATVFFPTNVALVAGQPYFLQPVIENGSLVASVNVVPGNQGGLYVDGFLHSGSNLWFTEGIVAPHASGTLVPNQGIVLSWDSSFGPLTNAVYAVQRASDLHTAFSDLATNLCATPPSNVYWDRSATNSGPYFYRIKEQ